LRIDISFRDHWANPYGLLGATEEVHSEQLDCYMKVVKFDQREIQA